ncbi:norbelladine synthase-like [Corylus avellana]|uniref:norbelladine synthase-like n=1 Tax=Corylus avellana TaxID=13451 RepID=UPI001E1FB5E9|nr:norbelladine synthase-like [Corylus avellana]
MVGQVSNEVEVNVAASEAWEIYGTLRLAKVVEEALSGLNQKVEVIEGDGGVGTVLKLTFGTAGAPFASLKEKFTKVDHEKRLKEVQVIEGGYLDIGFTLYRVRFEIIEKGDDSCIIKSTIEFNVKEEAAANASYVTIEPLAKVAEFAKTHLLKNKAA